MKRGLRLSTQATAYHEAGHAVVAHVLGHRIKRITIVPSKSQNYAGCVFFAKQPSVKRIDYDPSPRITRAAKERILASLVGLCAQRLFNSRTCRSFHGYEDFKQILLYVGNLMRENETEPFLKWMEVRTENLLRDNWKAVNVLAHELIRRREIGGQEAHQIIHDAPFEPRWIRQRHRVLASLPSKS
jgi:ATP-dependent Zn protease